MREEEDDWWRIPVQHRADVRNVSDPQYLQGIIPERPHRRRGRRRFGDGFAEDWDAFPLTGFPHPVPPNRPPPPPGQRPRASRRRATQ